MNDPEIDILLVEDNEDDIHLTVAALQAQVTQNVAICRDGAEALEFLFCEGQYQGRTGRATPRLVLLDLKLPKLDGLEVLKRLKSDPRTCNVPIVMLTSSSRKTDVDICYKAGANSYLVKSVDYAVFKKEIAQVGSYWLGLNRS